MNVIGSRPDGWWKDRHKAMTSLVESLERWAENGDDLVTVVFERPPEPPIGSQVIEVGHAAAAKPDAADDEIVRRLGHLDPARVTVVTSDRRLAGRVRATGAAVEPAASFRRRVAETRS
jgi:uncharacterized protein YaiI (UPF0178 family)